jgi:uncharacterized protein (DUF2235 family)
MRIAFFCDGTWNEPASNTNVWRMHCASLQIPNEQNISYDAGVGTDGNPLDHLFGGALGAGLFGKIKDGYTRISNLYTQDDEIFIFGFSRGAYTARCIAGMIAVCGLPTQNIDAGFLDAAFAVYRKQADSTTLAKYAMYDAKLTMVGVWDTVGSLGIPALWGGISDLVYGFLSPQLHPDVKNAYHAMAIDEQRVQFPATLWEGPFDSDQTVEQVWFSGVHSDVGGGYTPDPNDNNTRLADVTLGWMMSRAQALGLVFDPAVLSQFVRSDGSSALGGRFAMDALHNSRTGLYTFTPVHHRPVLAGSTNSSTPVLSNSVKVRCEHDTSYRPVNLALVAAGAPDPGVYSMEDTVAETEPLDW